MHPQLAWQEGQRLLAHIAALGAGGDLHLRGRDANGRGRDQRGHDRDAAKDD
jgi:hypothetical protein